MNERIRTTGLVAAFILASAALSAIAAPRAPASDDAKEVERIRAAIAANAGKAIEKEGGSRILFKVDAAALREAMVTELRDDVYRTVRQDRIPFAGLALREGGVEIRIADAKNRERVLGKLAPSTDTAPSFAVADGGDGLVRLTPTDAGFAERLHELVGQSMAMIEQLLRNGNIRQVAVTPEGTDRIAVLLPGVRDPERVTAIVGRKARIAFRLVDMSMTATAALNGSPPLASEIVTDFKTKAPHLLMKDIAMDGEDIIDAAPGFDSANHDPIVSFRFNARGTRRFAQITADNVGRPFAIVLDDHVVSSPVIREPITGGSGQISGNFTLEDANTIAMLLRSGTLPGRLSVVDQQVVEAAK